jgi:hypothetical protein
LFQIDVVDGLLAGYNSPDLIVAWKPFAMKPSAAKPEQRDTAYEVNREEKLKDARSGIGWVIVLLAAVTAIPSIYDGLRNGVWISSATVSCAVLLVGNLLVYRSFTRRLDKLKELEFVPDERVSLTGPVATPATIQPVRHP